VKTENSGAGVMSDGTLFERLAPETGKACLSTVVRRKVSDVKCLALLVGRVARKGIWSEKIVLKRQT